MKIDRKFRKTLTEIVSAFHLFSKIEHVFIFYFFLSPKAKWLQATYWKIKKLHRQWAALGRDMRDQIVEYRQVWALPLGGRVGPIQFYTRIVMRQGDDQRLDNIVAIGMRLEWECQA